VIPQTLACRLDADVTWAVDAAAAVGAGAVGPRQGLGRLRLIMIQFCALWLWLYSSVALWDMERLLAVVKLQEEPIKSNCGKSSYL
jgi:hypothetical protein